MKKTLNVNIGAMAFTIDEDAFQAVSGYLDDIALRLDDDTRTEVLEDVEARIADILTANLTVPGQVVTLQMIRQAMAVIGRPECFGERAFATAPSRPAQNGPRRLYRSREHKALAGICGGIADFFNTDPTLVRVLFVILVLFFGLSLWVYIILWIVIPLAPSNNTCNFNNRCDEHR